MLKLCSTFVGAFAQVGGNLDSQDQSAQGALHIEQVHRKAEVYGRFMGGSDRKYKQFGSLWAICAIYANCAKPHKHWLFRISLIWRVGT